MEVRQAKEAARRWAWEQGERNPALVGAYLAGSILEAEEEEDWPASSDVDVVLVYSRGCCPAKWGKFQFQGVLLEGTCLEEGSFSSLEQVLTTHYLAYSLNAGEILWDPTGYFTRLHRAVSGAYAQEEWVRARCHALVEQVRKGLSNPPQDGFPQRVNGWLFPTGITCFPLLAADLRNCTVRKRYSAARQTLTRRGLEEYYPQLLELLVLRPLGREKLFAHLGQLEESFRLASGSQGPSRDYPFRGDISAQGAAVALEGSRELIRSPWLEEAVFWMGATFARCQIILDLDDPALGARRLEAFRAFLEDLGLRDEGDFTSRSRKVLEFLPELEDLAREVASRRERGFLSKDFDKKELTKPGRDAIVKAYSDSM